jgi:starch synthase
MESRASEILSHAFKISLSPEAYHHVLKTLQPNKQRIRTATARTRPITAEVELCAASSSYRFVKLQSHSLPLSVEIPLGTPTHSHLTNLVLKEIHNHSSCQDKNRLHSNFHELLRKLVRSVDSSERLEAVLSAEDLSIASRRANLIPVFKHNLTLDIAKIIQYDESISSSFSTVNPNWDRPPSSSLSLTTLIPLHVEIDGGDVEITSELIFDGHTEELNDLRIFVHWGSYNDIKTPWRDELTRWTYHKESRTIEINHVLHVFERGRYGATLFYMTRDSDTPVWLGEYKRDDTIFRVYVDNTEAIQKRIHKLTQRRQSVAKQLARSLQADGRIESVITRLRERYPLIGLGRVLSELADSGLYSETITRLLNTSDVADAGIRDTLKNFGIGELAFVSPEGPHATAGGLGQVSTGLLPSLAHAGIPVTLIAPLYSQKFGNKHSDAWLTIREGILLGESRVYPRYAGEITVSLPPSYSIATGNLCRYPSAIPIQVYEAYHASVRLLLLFNPGEFDVLYGALPVDRQIRRSVLFCRAALETISNKLFDIRPSHIISNDWMTALIPALQKLDTKYSLNENIQAARTVHILHNAGRDYHGVFPIHHGEEDLWGLFGLSGEHFFGFQDLQNSNLLNLTKGGVLHADSVLTVSSEYAEQIKRGEETAELSETLTNKGYRFTGISNGISTELVRRTALNLPKANPDHPVPLKAIQDGKNLKKKDIQESMGLLVGENYTLLSITGRLAEQKGLYLLRDSNRSNRIGILEEIMWRFSNLQIIIAGPPSSNDESSVRFIEYVYYLKRRFPKRVGSMIEFVPHRTILSFLFASDLLIMPSRFEPGGIAQLESLALGTAVVARNVGGLRATLENFNESEGTGNAFLCNEHSAEAFGNTLLWAISCIQRPDIKQIIIQNCFNSKHDWSDRIDEYRDFLKRTRSPIFN